MADVQRCVLHQYTIQVLLKNWLILIDRFLKGSNVQSSITFFYLRTDFDNSSGIVFLKNCTLKIYTF